MSQPVGKYPPLGLSLPGPHLEHLAATCAQLGGDRLVFVDVVGVLVVAMPTQRAQDHPHALNHASHSRNTPMCAVTR